MNTDTWVVVTDAGRARIFATDHELEDWVEVKDLLHPESRATSRELVSDMHDTSTRRGPRSRPTPKVDHHDLERERFARELSQALLEGLDHGDYAELVLVAPPQMMGWLRTHLDKNVASHLRAEINKDYSRLPLADLRDNVCRQLVA